MTANVPLNAMSGGETCRSIDLGSSIEAQVMLHGDPSLVTTVRANYTTAQTNTAVISNSAGTRLVVVQAYAALSAAVTATNVTVLMGFGSTTPTTTGVVLAHPGLSGGLSVSRGDGGGIIGVGGDGIPFSITITAPTGGSLDVVISYMPLPTAGF